MILAVDFDGTIVDHKFPDIGPEKENAINVLKIFQSLGHKIIIWTCRTDPYPIPLALWFRTRDFVPDAINENIDRELSFGFPKIVADYYIDDRNFPPFISWEHVAVHFFGKDWRNLIKW